MKNNDLAKQLAEQVRLFPAKPGVYIMKDSLSNIIYVGKAKRLKNRVMQYFYRSKNRAPKIDAMISSINSIEYLLTDTELDAFLLECRLIKEIKPRYNSQMKNDKRYVYIKININEKYPSISVTNKVDSLKADSLYFGPYTSRSSVERTVLFIKDNFPIRKCSSASFRRKSSRCLNYSLGKCMGVCRDDTKYHEYNECVKKIVSFLEGKDDSIIEALKENVSLAAERLEFEKAAKFRDDIRAIKHVLNRQSLIKLSSRMRNIIAIENIGENYYKIFLFKGNRLISSEPFDIGQIDKTSAVEYFHSMVLDGYKNKISSLSMILGQQDVDEAQIIYSYLKRKKNDIMSFWIPVSWLTDGNPRLKTGLEKIIDKLFQKD